MQASGTANSRMRRTRSRTKKFPTAAVKVSVGESIPRVNKYGCGIKSRSGNVQCGHLVGSLLALCPLGNSSIALSGPVIITQNVSPLWLLIFFVRCRQTPPNLMKRVWPRPYFRRYRLSRQIPRFPLRTAAPCHGKADGVSSVLTPALSSEERVKRLPRSAVGLWLDWWRRFR